MSDFSATVAEVLLVELLDHIGAPPRLPESNMAALGLPFGAKLVPIGAQDRRQRSPK